jgi:hypothetical protein
MILTTDRKYLSLTPVKAFIFFLWLYSPIQALAASMKLSVSLQVLDLGQSVGFLERVINSSQGLYLYTNTEQHTTQALNIHTLSGIRTHDPGVRGSEDSSCVRPLDYRYRPGLHYRTIIIIILVQVRSAIVM